jgi:hypothetical protein
MPKPFLTYPTKSGASPLASSVSDTFIASARAASFGGRRSAITGDNVISRVPSAHPPQAKKSGTARTAPAHNLLMLDFFIFLFGKSGVSPLYSTFFFCL